MLCMFKTSSVCFLLIISSAAAHADSWRPAETRLINSPSGNFSLLVAPSDSQSNAQLMLIKRVANDGLHTFQFPAVNSHAPASAFVTDDGLVLTLNEWGNLGYDHAIVIYGKDGKVVLDRRLDEVFNAREIDNFLQSASSRWWLARTEPIEMQGNTVRMTSVSGQPVYVYLEKGQVEVKSGVRFPRLLRRLRGDAPTLRKVVFDRWSSRGHVHCEWVWGSSKCERSAVDGKSSTTSTTALPASRLARLLRQVFTRAPSIDSADGCAEQCGNDSVRVKVFFRNQTDDGWTTAHTNSAGQISYQVVLDSAAKPYAAVLAALSNALEHAE